MDIIGLIYRKWANLMVYLTRGIRYLTILNSLMLIKIFWDTFEDPVIATVLLVFAVVSLIVISIIDFKGVMPIENGITSRQNTEWTLLMDRISNLEKMINDLGGRRI